MNTYCVGQTIWLELERTPGRPKAPLQEALVTKVGKKWVYFSDGSSGRIPRRFDPENMRVEDSYYTIVWASPEAYEDTVFRGKAWAAIREATNRNHSASTETLQKVLDLLGLTP